MFCKKKIRSLILKRRLKKANNKIIEQNTVKLSREEEAAIDKMWHSFPLASNYKKCFMFYKFYNNVIESQLVPNDFFYLCEKTLNPIWLIGYMQHKCFLKNFIPRKYRPNTICECVNNHLFDEKGFVVTRKQIEELLNKHSVFVFKPANGTGGGTDVRKVVLKKGEKIDWLFNYRDFILQELVCQNTFMSSFNRSSVNTIRMTTLNLNDICTVLSAFIRIGADGSFVDNITNKDGCVVGVKDDGCLTDYGLTSRYTKVLCSPSGQVFNGLEVPNYQKIKDIIISLHHSQLPFLNIINWDIAVDINDEIKILEINVNSMNAMYHQIFNGPYFKDRLEEVRTYVMNHVKDINMYVFLS